MSIKRRQSGVTLIELIVFIVIVSIAVVGILGVMSLTTAGSADPQRRKQALMIAESLMEEVQMAKFTFCDPTSPNADIAVSTADCAVPENWGNAGGEPAGARPFNNVNDYVTAPGTAQATFGAGTSVTDASGALFGSPGYAATVAITPAALYGIGGAGASADTAVLRITVTVTYSGETLVLDGYRTRYAPN